METFEYKGIWWLPDKPHDKIPGFLKYDPKEGGSLELIGNLNSLSDFKSLSAPVIILGETVEGKKVTLYKCFEKSRELNFPGQIRSLFFINVIFIGCHFQKEEDILFDEISINFSNLEEWVGLGGIKSRKTDKPNGHLKKEYYIEPPQEIAVKLEKTDIYINFSYNCKFTGYSLNLKQTTFIKIKPKNPISIIEYFNGIIRNIQDFLTLAMGKAVYPMLMTGKSNNSVIELANGQVLLNDIYVYTRMGAFADYSSKIYQRDILFKFCDIADKLDICLQNWINKTYSLGPIYELYFGTFYNPTMYRSHEFLSLVQALESYHRRILNGKYVTDEEFEPLYEAIKKAVPNDIDCNFRESLLNKAKYLNEFSLRKRLRDIIDRLGDWIETFINSPESFIEDVCNTRNYLTHYDERLESKAKTGEELYWLVQRMRFLLEICFLKELGLSEEKIKALVIKYQKYGYLLGY
ncbi:MAG: hypothetical protein QHH43_05290 [Candidatus Saccharicenans sp.]|jgi:hypothetical protein|nr:hypothetical protein [Candidatus Saccharicenans sp.]MDH7575156.1 hypothetical protein [Candidatus Saccharicenans sp.]